MNNTHLFANRFRGYLPVVIDVETGGFNAKKDALLEIAAVLICKVSSVPRFSITKLIGLVVETAELTM